MKGHQRLKPVDLISYLALLALMLTTLVIQPPHSTALLLKYGGLALVLTLLWWMDQGRFWLARGLHAFYPIVFIPILFDSFADLLPWVSPIVRDPVLIQLDLALLGTHPTVWLERFIHPWLTEILTWAYATYYFLPVVLVVALYWRGKEMSFDRAVFGVVLGFYLSFLGYFLFPAIGPRFTLTHLQTVDLHGIFSADTIRDTLNFLERFKQDAFPSGHTAVVLLVLFYAWQFVRGLFWVFLPVVVALIFSTVYLRYHYMVDVLAGIALAVLCVVLERMTTNLWHR
jgi:membrane-associated phospholipid phosphatase